MRRALPRAAWRGGARDGGWRGPVSINSAREKRRHILTDMLEGNQNKKSFGAERGVRGRFSHVLTPARHRRRRAQRAGSASRVARDKDEDRVGTRQVCVVVCFFLLSLTLSVTLINSAKL